MLEKGVPRDKLEEILQNFKCSYDQDIENFLKNKALEYEKRKWCSTYLLMDKDKMLAGEFFIEGFFTLSFKSVSLSDDISNSTRKKLYGGINKKDKHIPFVLIGQLAKYIDKKNEENVEKSSITSNDLLEGAFEIIEQVNERIPLRCVLVECKALEKLCNMYEECGFRKLQENELMQYFKKI